MKIHHGTVSALVMVIALGPVADGARGVSATGGHPVHQHDQRHHDSASGAAAAIPAPAGGWATDARLRAGMQAILDATVEAIATQHEGAELAGELRGQIQLLFKECKLEPAADAALHQLIAELLVSVQRLEAGATPAEAHDALHATLVRYGRNFDHPDWPLR